MSWVPLRRLHPHTMPTSTDILLATCTYAARVTEVFMRTVSVAEHKPRISPVCRCFHRRRWWRPVSVASVVAVCPRSQRHYILPYRPQGTAHLTRCTCVFTKLVAAFTWPGLAALKMTVLPAADCVTSPTKLTLCPLLPPYLDSESAFDISHNISIKLCITMRHFLPNITVNQSGYISYY